MTCFSRRHLVKDVLIFISFSFIIFLFYMLNKFDRNKRRLFETISYEEALDLETKDYEDEFVKVLVPKYDRNNLKFLKHLSKFENGSLSDSKLNSFIREKANNSRVIFIGGYARSGTTLARAILDVHKSISCGTETKILPLMLSFFTNYFKTGVDLNTLNEQKYGVELAKLNQALMAFILTLTENRAGNAPRPCAKDPDILYYMFYLHRMFPQAKFIYMVRDGRAAAYSLLERMNEPKTFKKLKTYLITWNNYNQAVYKQCQEIGFEYCLIVKYEQLILNSKETIQKVMQFLGEEFSEDLLNHHKYIGDRVKVSQSEWSTDQIMKPINTKSLTTWIDNLVPGYDSARIKYIMPMLTKFNYSIDIQHLDYASRQKLSKSSAE